MKASELIKIANEARKNAYAPYSGITSGAALVTTDGKVYTAGNIENATPSVGICAESAVIIKAVSEGEKSFAALAVVAGKNGVSEWYATPCGSCLQVMREFCNGDFRVFAAKPSGNYFVLTLRDLLPYGFENGITNADEEI